MREVQEQSFRTGDGCEIHFRHWPATATSVEGAIVLFHRGHEHGGRMAHLVDELDLPGFHFFAWDARGLGKSGGERGSAESFSRLVKDVDEFIAHLRRQYSLREEEIGIVAQSVGSVLVATWVHDYAPRLRAMVLAAPAFKIKLYVPLARPGLRLLSKVTPRAFVTSYVKAKFLTHDPARIQSYEADSLIVRPIAVNVLLGLHDAAKRAVSDAAAIRVPAQVLISGSDWVVHKKPQRLFFERLESPVKELHEFPGFFHDTLGERDRKEAVEKVRGFLTRCFSAPPEGRTLLGSDQAGPTKVEHQRLAKPLPPLSPRSLYWAATRLQMRTLGRLSEGIRLGWKTGFDSGSTLDYVYRNEARGLTPLGKLIDRVYLDSIGWRGIRVRKENLKDLIGQAASLLSRDGQSLRIVDVAAGHGRYVVEAIETAALKPDSLLLRDFSPINVEAGRKLLEERRFSSFARFVAGDAFDRESLSTLAPRPTLGIVSGLFELFPENRAVLESLRGLAGAIAAGGYLVYTNQPWHPQIELIARVLTSHREGKSWVMRRRTQREMDELVAEAGFTKLDERIDPWGIFTVSLARRDG
jgi:alpha-beta hydrolase superfamily lysophospholipase/SAM-dependent methyltransferase